ncbi:transmembrane protein 238-like isoform X2 [Pseudonaja textilis]|uniref:transmembrane protein 238-like isoform X2 n=1 Tax=Pseudonaja textilis TaxID=8673 RepID=UPI000EA86091|nr:transmembrane protein 238-like isoform X2 [Pseudonaja textilis]
MAAAEAPRRKRSRCRGALGLALVFDALGLAGLLVGGLLETDVSDLLIYLGGVAAFFSLPWWVFWHVGNLEVPLEELRDDVGLGWRSADAWSLESWRARRLALLARAFSAHFSLPSASTSAQSQVGRLRAHFAASTTSGSSGGGGSGSRAEKKKPQQEQQQRRPSQTQDSGSELRSARLPFALPAFSFSSAGPAASQDLPGSSHSQDRGKQESSKSFFNFPNLRGSSHSKDRGKEESSRSLFNFLCHKHTQTDE